MFKKKKMKIWREGKEGYKNITLEHATKTQRGSRGRALLFL
jgi:hypothetical protein